MRDHYIKHILTSVAIVLAMGGALAKSTKQTRYTTAYRLSTLGLCYATVCVIEPTGILCSPQPGSYYSTPTCRDVPKIFSYVPL